MKYTYSELRKYIWIFNIALIVFAAIVFFTSKNDSIITDSSNSPQTKPKSGVLSQNIFSKHGTPQAPLNIRNTTFQYDAYIKLISCEFNSTAFTMFIKQRDSIKLLIPLGSYRVKYATGVTWHGEKVLFGPDTRYYEVDKIFIFEEKGDKVIGHDFEILSQSRGSANSTKISQKNF